jgi:hypothetical protein
MDFSHVNKRWEDRHCARKHLMFKVDSELNSTSQMDEREHGCGFAQP